MIKSRWKGKKRISDILTLTLNSKPWTNHWDTYFDQRRIYVLYLTKHIYRIFEGRGEILHSARRDTCTLEIYLHSLLLLAIKFGWRSNFLFKGSVFERPVKVFIPEAREKKYLSKNSFHLWLISIEP